MSCSPPTQNIIMSLFSFSSHPAQELFIKVFEVSELRHEAVVPVVMRTGGCVLAVSLRWIEADHPPHPFCVSI